MIRLITISRVSCVIFLLCFLYHDSRVQKSALLCFDDSKGGIKIIATIRSSHNSDSVPQFLEVNEAPCCSSPWKQCTLSNHVQLKFNNITTLLEYPFESLLFKVRNKCFPNGNCRDGIWYHLNNFKQPTVSQSVNIAVSVKTSKTETKHLGEIHLNTSYPLNVNHRGAHKCIARLLTPPLLPLDLGPDDPVISVAEKFLLVPEVTSKTDLEHRQIKNGSLEYLVVDQTLFSFSKEKYLTEINHFLSMDPEDPENHKYLEAISQDMNKQPFDLWIQDRIQQLLGKTTKYFLSSYGTLATNHLQRRNAVSFWMDQDLMVEVTILSSNSPLPSDHVQLTVRRGILMTLLGTISDPYRLIHAIYSTVSVSVSACRDSLIFILSCLCKVLSHLQTVSSEFVGHYDDDTVQKEFWKAWNVTTFILYGGSNYNLPILTVLRILFVCVIVLISWLFIQKNLLDGLHIQTAVSCPSSSNVDHFTEEILPAGTKVVPSLSETSINSDCSEDSWTSCKSSLCQYPLSLDEVVPPDEDEIEDDFLDDEFCPFLSRHDDCLSECSEPFEVMSLPDENLTTIIPEIPDAEDGDADVDEEPVQYEVAERGTNKIQYMKLMTIWASEFCQLKGFYLNPHWKMMQCLVRVKKIKYTDKPRIVTRGPDNEPCALVRLAKSQTVNDPVNTPNFGQWVFSGNINPNWVFQNQWPSYTWSTSSYLPVISGTLMRGLPWRDVIYFPGGFIAPCPAVNYRTESLAYLS